MEQERSARQGQLARWWSGFVCAPLRQANDEALAHLNSPQARRLDGRVLTVLLTVSVLLTLQHYLLSDARDFFYTMQLLDELGLGGLARWWRESLGPPRQNHFRWLMYWAMGSFVLYFVPAALLVRFVFRQKLGEYGFKLRGAFTDGWVYPVMFAIVGPLVLVVSRDAHFQATYPFIHVPADGSLWPWFWIWEMAYALQFLGLEFFFRGFMIHGLRHRFGAYAIPIMVVPYCMIHFAKPLPETFGAIIAGLVLGFMSLRTRSVLLGAAIHVSVAVSMDLTSLWRQGYFR